MLVLWNVIVFLGLSVMCDDGGELPTQSFDTGYNTGDFYITIGELSSKQPEKHPYRGYGTNDHYICAMGMKLQLVCFYKVKDESTDLYWEDNNGFTSGKYHQMPGYDSTIKLRVSPDAEDVTSLMPRLTCVAKNNNDRKQISITLNVTQGATSDSDEKAMVKYINRGEPLRNNVTCNAIVYPQKGKAPFRVLPHETLIQNFTEQYNDTIVYCYLYKIKGNITNGILFARTKSKYVYYLNETNINGSQMDSSDIEDDEGKETKPSPTYNVIAIVSGIIGSVIVLLILIFVCHKKKRQRRSVNEATVIYAEIYSTPPQVDFPRRDEQQYAKIVGVLMPKQGPEDTQEAHYCTVR